jgi:predicted tellurium resistance membrane protein TerC
MEALIALIALTVMEIVLGIDNIIFIAIITQRLPVEQQPLARQAGLAAALVMRILLLLMLTWIMGLTEPLFTLTGLGIPEAWFGAEMNERAMEINQVSWRDLILLAGGLFLIGSSVNEIHEQFNDEDVKHTEPRRLLTFSRALFQIAVFDILFSLDSVITAVGMVKPEDLWVMITAVILAIVVMMIFAERISRFVSNHPTVKMLAISFLLMIGMMLVADAIGTHIEKGYIYFAMAFALGVESLNLISGGRT